MSQSKKQSVLESIMQTLIGLGTSILVQIIIYPLMGIPVAVKDIIATKDFVTSNGSAIYKEIGRAHV